MKNYLIPVPSPKEKGVAKIEKKINAKTKGCV